MKKTEEKVINFISRQELIFPGDRILVSLSGGADSVFLLKFLKKFQSKYEIKLGAYHLNHQLRGTEADEDEIFCRELTAQNEIPYYSSSKSINIIAKELKVSLEEAGRITRYQELETVSKEYGYNKIATAHNSGDNSETVILNLIKGAGLKGISGIPAKRGNIIRPLLVLTKPEITAYLEKLKVSFRTDSSNESNEYQRNLIRNKVLPVLREINPSLDNSILTSSRIFGNLEHYLSSLLPSFEPENNGDLIISLDIITKIAPAMAGYLIKNCLERNFSVTLTFNDIESVLDLLNKETGKRVVISDGIVVCKERDHLFFTKNAAAAEINAWLEPGESVPLNDEILETSFVEEMELSGSRDKEFISGDLVKGSLEVRNWNPGDRFYPIGMKGSKKVSDYLNDLKIDSHKKNNQLVLVNNNKIIWVIGERLDNRFRVTKNSKRIIQLWLKKK